jgi:hypothetical protein
MKILILMFILVSCQSHKALNQRSPSDDEHQLSWHLLQIPRNDKETDTPEDIIYPLELEEDLTPFADIRLRNQSGEFKKPSKKNYLFLVGSPDYDNKLQYYPHRIRLNHQQDYVGFTDYQQRSSSNSIVPWFVLTKNSQGISSVHSFFDWTDLIDLTLHPSTVDSSARTVTIKNNRAFPDLPNAHHKPKGNDEKGNYLIMDNIWPKRTLFYLLNKYLTSDSEFQFMGNPYLEERIEDYNKQERISVFPKPHLIRLIENEIYDGIEPRNQNGKIPPREINQDKIQKLVERFPKREIYNISSLTALKYAPTDMTSHKLAKDIKYNPLTDSLDYMFRYIFYNSQNQKKKILLNREDVNKFNKKMMRKLVALGYFFFPLDRNKALIFKLPELTDDATEEEKELLQVKREAIRKRDFRNLPTEYIRNPILYLDYQINPGAQEEYLLDCNPESNLKSVLIEDFNKFRFLCRDFENIKANINITQNQATLNLEISSKLMKAPIKTSMNLMFEAQLLPFRDIPIFIDYKSRDQSVFSEPYKYLYRAYRYLRLANFRLGKSEHPNRISFKNCFDTDTVQASCLTTNRKKLKEIDLFNPYYDINPYDSIDLPGMDFFSRAIMNIHIYRLNYMFNMKDMKGFDRLNSGLDWFYEPWVKLN